MPKSTATRRPSPAEIDRAIAVITRRTFTDPAELRRLERSNSRDGGTDAVDYHFVPPGSPNTPDETFDRVRWGGQVIAITHDREQITQVSRQYQARSGFQLEQGPRTIHTGPLGGRLPFMRHRWRYMIARKISLLAPGRTTDRFTFHVELMRQPGRRHYVVLKKVPTYGSVMVRLKQRLPDTPEQTLADRARKLVDKIFPVFLTREAAFLKLLARDLPAEYRDRVPHLLGTETGPDGKVRKLAMNWMRLGTEPIDQMTFALQAAELVRALHDKVGLIHLDLRMDNIVITNQGVGFVDFGSAVRVGEDLSENPMLETLFSEMMSTSQIQVLLGRMAQRGKVTNQAIVQGHRKVDKAADLFYLMMQIANPHTNPDLNPLIIWDKQGRAARKLTRLAKRVLQPPHPEHPEFQTASDILRGLYEIDAELRGEKPAQPASTIGSFEA